MADEVRQTALRAIAALAALEAVAGSGNRLWPGDLSKLSAARAVAEGLVRG